AAVDATAARRWRWLLAVPARRRSLAVPAGRRRRLGEATAVRGAAGPLRRVGGCRRHGRYRLAGIGVAVRLVPGRLGRLPARLPRLADPDHTDHHENEAEYADAGNDVDDVRQGQLLEPRPGVRLGRR